MSRVGSVLFAERVAFEDEFPFASFAAPNLERAIEVYESALKHLHGFLLKILSGEYNKKLKNKIPSHS